MEKLKYPVKYAVMPIIDQVTFPPSLNEVEKEFGTVCYITSKCYVTSEKKEYFQDGTYRMSYDVVFPFQKKDNSFERVYPDYNLYRKCINSARVNKLYENPESAKVAKNIANEKVLYERLRYLPFDDDFNEKVEKIEDEFQGLLDKYNLLEEQIELGTTDMKVVEDVNRKLIKKTN